MKLIGDFAEFESGTSLASSLSLAINDPIHDRLRRLVGIYLLRARLIRYTMERLPDVLDGEEVFLTASLSTDGLWCWREDYAHYVLKYGAPVPPEFVSHAESNDWSPPRLTDDECASVAKSVQGLAV